MDNVIKDVRVAADNWQLLEADAAVPASGAVIVPLATWLAARTALAARAEPLGLWLAGDAEPAQIADALHHFALIAIRFPKFGDGRGFSTARLLRERYGFRGELRAFGDLLRDLLPELHRCGFDSVVLRESEDPHAALQALDALPEIYAASVTTPQPLFRRRLATAGEQP